MDGLAYTVIGIIGSFSLLKLMAGKDGAFATVFLNVVLGGALFAMLNICNFIIPFNIVSATCITLLGFPGVILLIILKIMFGF